MILTAEIAKVQIGLIWIDGLMDENGNFYVGIPQVADLNLVQRQRSLKRLESSIGMTFQNATKLKTPLNPKAVNAISLRDFEIMLAKLDRKGNIQAQQFRDDLVGFSLHQLFCDAFKIKFEEDDRQQWLRLRQISKFDFRALTDQLKAHGFTEGWQYGKFVNQFQSYVGIDKGTRDEQIREKLGELIKVQAQLTAYMECGIKPFEALAKLR